MKIEINLKHSCNKIVSLNPCCTSCNLFNVIHTPTKHHKYLDYQIHLVQAEPQLVTAQGVGHVPWLTSLCQEDLEEY